MNQEPSTFIQGFHGDCLKNYENAMIQYSQLGKTDMQVSHISLGGASFGNC